MNIVKPFPAPTAPFPLMFLLNLSHNEEVALVANLDKNIFSQRNSEVY